jgi:hypothetical protein
MSKLIREGDRVIIPVGNYALIGERTDDEEQFRLYWRGSRGKMTLLGTHDREQLAEIGYDLFNGLLNDLLPPIERVPFICRNVECPDYGSRYVAKSNLRPICAACSEPRVRIDRDPFKGAR